MKASLYLCLGFLILVTSGCKKEEEPTPQEMLEGKWIIQSSEILATIVPGDGSYLIFNGCGVECTGTDFDASNATSGSFSYVLNEEASAITITDTTSDGGNYNATWDILELTETDFRMIGNTAFGTLKIEMTKE